MYITTYAIDLVALVYLAVLTASSTSLRPYRKKPFLMGVFITVIIILSEAGTIFTCNEGSSLRSLNIIFNVLGFSLTPILPVVIASILDINLFRKSRLLLVPTVVNTVLVLLSPFYGLIFVVDAYSEYTRGDLFFIFLAAYILNFTVVVLSTLALGREHSYPMLHKVVGLSLIVLIGTSIQLVYPTAYSSWHCATLSLLLYFFVLSEFDSSFDSLTGLYNRGAFERATHYMAENEAFSIIMIDIDNFKGINDANGHNYGDVVIREVACAIKQSFDRSYRCYRFGGDEFAVLGRETDRQKIESQLQIMTENLAALNANIGLLPTVSYGYSVFHGGEALDFQMIFKEADDQMYESKRLYKAKQ